MKGDNAYSYRGSDGFVIENGILRGFAEPYITEHSSYGELILEQLRAAPEFVGQVNGITGKKETFDEMTEKSVKCAMWLKEQNVKPGDIIGICTHNQTDMYVPCFASLYIGAVFNPWWDVGITKDMTKHFLTLTHPMVLFADESSAGLALEVAKELDVPLKVVVFGNLPGFQSLDDIFASQDTETVSQFRCTKLLSHEDFAVILYTSGSTGLPKGALHSHRSLFGNLQSFNAIGKIKGTTISMIFAPLAWCTGILCMLKGVVRRETRIIHPEFTEEILFQLIEKYKVNWMHLGTSVILRIRKSLATPNYDLSSLKYLYIGGNVLNEEIHKEVVASLPHTNVLQIYGTTESFGALLVQDSERPKLGSAGKVLKNTTMKVIDTESGVVLGPNQTGEACFKYPFVMTGYYENPSATTEAIDAEGWLHSGDIVHYDEEGSIFFTDRIKEMIKYRGHHISSAMIEQVLQAHPEVVEAAVMAALHGDEECPTAFVVKTPNGRVTKEDLQKLVTDKLPDYMKLRGGVEFLEEFPHTSSGKISKRDLRKIVLQSHSDDPSQ